MADQGWIENSARIRRAVTISLTALFLLAGCGSSSTKPPATIQLPASAPIPTGQLASVDSGQLQQIGIQIAAPALQPAILQAPAEAVARSNVAVPQNAVPEDVRFDTFTHGTVSCACWLFVWDSPQESSPRTSAGMYLLSVVDSQTGKWLGAFTV